MSISGKKTIVVPWDFTPAAKIALQHAYQLARVVGDNIALVSLIPEPGLLGSKEKYYREFEEKRERLRVQAQELEQEYAEQQARMQLEAQEDAPSGKRTVHEVALIPSVLGFSNLSKAFRELYHTMDVNLIVTSSTYEHQSKNVDLITALQKVKLPKIESLPFIVVNTPPKHDYYSEIVVPMGYDQASKQSLRWVAFLSTYYLCNVNIIKPSLLEESKKKKMANNIYFAKSVLTAKDVIYGIKTADRKQIFADEVFKFATDIDADMLVLMTDRFDKFFPTGRIDIEVPVMMVNPLKKKFQAFN